MQPFSGNQHPDLLTLSNISDEHVSCACACHGKCIFADPLQTPHACHRFWICNKNPHVWLTFDKVHNPLRLPRKKTSERPKALRTRQFFALLTCKCASRCNGVRFFQHDNFQKWSEHGVSCRFWL